MRIIRVFSYIFDMDMRKCRVFSYFKGPNHQATSIEGTPFWSHLETLFGSGMHAKISRVFDTISDQFLSDFWLILESDLEVLWSRSGSSYISQNLQKPCNSRQNQGFGDISLFPKT